jgi:hypothetical protein
VLGVRRIGPGPRLLEHRRFDRPPTATYGTDICLIRGQLGDGGSLHLHLTRAAAAPLCAAARMLLPCALRSAGDLLAVDLIELEGAPVLCFYDRTPGASGFCRHLEGARPARPPPPHPPRPRPPRRPGARAFMAHPRHHPRRRSHVMAARARPALARRRPRSSPTSRRTGAHPPSRPPRRIHPWRRPWPPRPPLGQPQRPHRRPRLDPSHLVVSPPRRGRPSWRAPPRRRRRAQFHNSIAADPRFSRGPRHPRHHPRSSTTRPSATPPARPASSAPRSSSTTSPAPTR